MHQLIKPEPAKRSINHSIQRIYWVTFFATVWLFLWFAPWNTWFEANLWLKVGMALAVFITPGANLYLLIGGEGINRSSIVTSGFVFSHLLIALLGFAGRVFQFSFIYVKAIFMTLGLTLMVINILTSRNSQISNSSIRKLLSRYSSYWPLAILEGLTMLMTIQRVLTGDDLAYLAHLTNWQNMPTLNFSDVYFNIDKVESTRFWIVSTPFSQAFLGDIAKIPGLILLTGYYEPFLALISVLCFHELARTLGLARTPAMASVAVQMAFMALLSDYLHPGAPFFHQLSTDKATAAFILTPVFISHAVRSLRTSKMVTRLNFFLTGVGLGFMHPILSAFAVFIVGSISLFGLKRKNFRRNMIVILLAAIPLLPLVGVRLIDHEAQPKIPNDIGSIETSPGIDSMISRIENTRFYGFNPTILEMRFPYQDRLPFSVGFLSWIWIIIPILAALFSLKGLRNTFIKQYILAVTLLVTIAGIPFTGWILGYFVSAWMLERTTWIYPFGISLIFLLIAFRNGTNLGKAMDTWKRRMRNNFQVRFLSFSVLPVWAIAIVLMLFVMREQGLPDTSRLQSSTRRHQELAFIGAYIDQNTNTPVNVVGTDDLEDFIPALSWKAKVISYRPEDSSYPYFYTEAERQERWADRQAIMTRGVSPEGKMELIKKYKIRYFLLESYRFGIVKDLVSTYPESFNVLSFGRYYLIECIDFS